jgi:hypothetical protein
MVCGVVGSVGDGSVSEGRLPVYRGSYVCGGSVNRDVKIVYSVISFCFCCEM